ncbi:tetratricopeptide repeat protein [Dyella jejuensis]|uniref:Tetratricopeptide repeat protein n=1 Tax=Dyella jejuensis TaxID=1432009 RepID=A0ABW8JKZ6_9GAMM
MSDSTPTFPATLLDAMRQVGTLLQAGDLRRAQDRLESIVEHHPDYAEAWRLLGGVRQAFGDHESAEAFLRKAMAIDPGWAPTFATLGELLLNSGRHDEAESLLRRAAQRLPQAALLLARHCNAQQRPAEALALVAPLCASGQADAEWVTQHVTALAALGRQHEALAFYRRAADAAPDSPAAAHALAIALGAAALHAEAEHASSHALARGHTTAAVYFTHASNLVALGDFDRAETALRDCLQREPRHIEAHNHLARLVWMRTGDHAQAIATLDQALQAFPGDDALLAAKAAVLQGAGDARGAYASLSAQAARAQATPALLVRAGLAALEFDPDTARALAERALRLSPSATAARNLLAAALLGVGDARGALLHVEALRVNAPDDQYLIALQTTAWRLLGDARYDLFCDYPQLVRQYLLQTPSAWPDLASFLAELKDRLERLHPPDGHPLLFQSLRHGTETTEDLTRHADPLIRALFEAFDAPIRDYLAYLGHGDDPLRRRNRSSYRFNGSWSVRLRRAGYHTSHVHPRGWISSACYVDLPDGMGDASTPDGCLAFGVPSVMTVPALQAEHVVRPEAGRLVLFPSYFWHGTVPFHSDRARLTVAFDVIPGALT